MTLAHDSQDHAWMRQIEAESESVINFRTAWGPRGPRYIAYAQDEFHREAEGSSRLNWMEALDNLAIEIGVRTPAQIEALNAERDAADEARIASALNGETA